MGTLRVVLAFAALGFAATSSAVASKAPKAFATPREAGEQLVAAAAADDVPALIAIFGSDGAKLVASGDEVQDRNDRARFADSAREKLDVSTDSKRAHRAMLVVGSEAWPFPVPLVEKKGKWAFSSKEGLREVLAGESARTSSTPSRSAGATWTPSRSTQSRIATATGSTSTRRR
jgi:hypothetical protein